MLEKEKIPRKISVIKDEMTSIAKKIIVATLPYDGTPGFSILLSGC